MRIVVLLSVLILGLQEDQKDWGKVIIGKWEGVSKVMIEEGDTVDYSLDQKGYKNDGLLEFKSNGYLKVFPDTDTTYDIDGNLLMMGNRLYTIKQITNDKMIVTIEAFGEGSEFWLTFRRISS